MQTISIWSPCGGAGKTTLSLLIAGALKARGFKVVVCDLAENQDALDVGSRNKLDFPVYSTDQETASLLQNSDIDFLVMDYDVNVQLSSQTDLVVIPVRPSVLHMKKLNNQWEEEVAHLNCLPVFNLVDTSREEHKRIYSQNGDWPIIKNRAIYERMLENCTTIFSQDAEKWASSKPTRDEVNLLVDLMIYKLNGKLPENKESIQRVMSKLGSAA